MYLRPMIFVTGGSGFLGAHLLARLVENKTHVRAYYRNPKRLQKVREVFNYYFPNDPSYFELIDWVKGDINDAHTLSKALNGVEQVYHLAGFINFEWRRYDQLKQTNTAGTSNVVNCCLAAGVKRFCYISSIAALGQNVGLLDQGATGSPEFKDPYGLTKYGGELEVWRGAQEGLEVLILRPGVILGEGYWHSGSGFLLKFVSTQPKWYPPGGTGFVDVKDVVNFSIHLMQQPKYNLTYTLVGHNMTYLEVLNKIGLALGVKRTPKWATPLWVGLLAHYLDFVRALITRGPQKLPKAYIHAMFELNQYDGASVQTETGLSYTGLEQTLERVCGRAPYRITD